MTDNDYDPIGGHTKEEADAAYEALFRELHASGKNDEAGVGRKPKVYVLGPKNPDTDAVCGAVAYAALRNRIDDDRVNIPRIAGCVNAQTERVFARFSATLPKAPETPARTTNQLCDSDFETASGADFEHAAEVPSDMTDRYISSDMTELIMIGHNDEASAVENLHAYHISEIIDCHKLGVLTTDYPVRCTIRPVGAVCTIIYGMYKESDIEPSRAEAGLLCAGIISATQLFSTKETTRADKIAAVELATRIEVDLQEFADEILDEGGR